MPSCFHSHLRSASQCHLRSPCSLFLCAAASKLDVLSGLPMEEHVLLYLVYLNLLYVRILTLPFMSKPRQVCTYGWLALFSDNFSLHNLDSFFHALFIFSVSFYLRMLLFSFFLPTTTHLYTHSTFYYYSTGKRYLNRYKLCRYILSGSQFACDLHQAYVSSADNGV